MDPRSTAAARIKVKVKDGGKINVINEVDGAVYTSKHSLQSSTYGRDQEWVLLAPT